MLAKLNDNPVEIYKQELKKYLDYPKSHRMDKDKFIIKIKNLFKKENNKEKKSFVQILFDEKLNQSLSQLILEYIKAKQYLKYPDVLELINLFKDNGLLTEDQLTILDKKIQLSLNQLHLNKDQQLIELQPSNIDVEPPILLQFFDSLKTQQNLTEGFVSSQYSNIYPDEIYAFQALYRHMQAQSLNPNLPTEQKDELIDKFLKFRDWHIEYNSMKDPKNFILQQLLKKKQFDKNIQNKLHQYFEMIQITLGQINWSEFGIEANKVYLAKFGSMTNGFAISSSDMDLVILTDSYIDERKFLKLLAKILENILDSDVFKVQAVLNDSIRIPIITLITNESPKMAIDLIVNNMLGVINAQMLYTYSQIDQRVEQLGKLVKIWAKAQKISGKQDLSSYAFTLLVIFYLQQIGVVPALQEIVKEKTEISIKRMISQNQMQQFKTNVAYETDQQMIKRKLFDLQMDKFDAWINVNELTLFDLFKGFLKFYSQNGTVITNNFACDISKSGKEFKSQLHQDFLYSIIDPFDLMHNPGDKIKMKDKNKVFFSIKKSQKILERDKLNIEGLIPQN